jgi:hypothetical protein
MQLKPLLTTPSKQEDCKGRYEAAVTERTQQIDTKVLSIQLSQHNHYLDPTASKQCPADKEEHDIGNHPYGGGLHPLTTKGGKYGVTLKKSTLGC